MPELLLLTKSEPTMFVVTLKAFPILTYNIIWMRELLFLTKSEPTMFVVTLKAFPTLTYNIIWMRELDLNQRPSGYEPDELPDCSIPHQQGAKLI